MDEGPLMAAVPTDYLDAACEAARRGAAVLEDWRSRFQVREKARFDLVTDADLASQQAVRSYLAERFPDHGFVGEEEGAATTSRSAGGATSRCVRARCGGPARRRSTSLTSPPAASTATGPSTTMPGTWPPASSWCRRPAASSPAPTARPLTPLPPTASPR